MIYSFWPPITFSFHNQTVSFMKITMQSWYKFPFNFPWMNVTTFWGLRFQVLTLPYILEGVRRSTSLCILSDYWIRHYKQQKVFPASSQKLCFLININKQWLWNEVHSLLKYWLNNLSLIYLSCLQSYHWFSTILVSVGVVWKYTHESLHFIFLFMSVVEIQHLHLFLWNSSLISLWILFSWGTAAGEYC